MKIIVGIINGKDANKVSKKLSLAEFGVTKLSSTGGFLRDGNTTLLVGVEDERLNDALDIIRENSKRRTTLVPPSDISPMVISAPLEVTIGGATVFIIDVEQFEKM